jgi:hypothetical protein
MECNTSQQQMQRSRHLLTSGHKRKACTEEPKEDTEPSPNQAGDLDELKDVERPTKRPRRKGDEWQAVIRSVQQAMDAGLTGSDIAHILEDTGPLFLALQRRQ